MTKSYCAYLWNHICVRPDYKLQPCCRFQMAGEEPMDIQNSLESAYNSPLYQKLRQQALAGVPIAGCRKCYDQEADGFPSLR